MQLQQAISHVFLHLNNVLNQLTNEQYQLPGKALSNATIGQHVRHILELYTCLYTGYQTGIVNYDNRQRDTRIEQDKNFAADLIQEIIINLQKADKELILEASYEMDGCAMVQVATNYFREIMYNLEHTVHHMALIRIGLKEVSMVNIPEGFGIAASTIKFRKTVMM